VGTLSPSNILNYYYGTHQNQVVQSFNPGLQLKFLRHLTCNCLKLGVV
jgi:hypothetical protein